MNFCKVGVKGTYENLSFHTVLATWSKVITPRIVSLIAPQVALKSTFLGFKDILNMPVLNVTRHSISFKKWQCKKYDLKKEANEKILWSNN